MSHGCLSLTAVLLLGCGSAAQGNLDSVFPDHPPPGEPTPPEAVAPEAPRQSPPRVPLLSPPGILARIDVDDVLRQGFGAFLARIEVSPVLDRGHFVGFRLDRADDLARWRAAGADVRVGDVITRVNGGSIERPEAALAVFEGLRAAREIRVEVLRGAAAVVITQPIVEPAAPAH